MSAATNDPKQQQNDDQRESLADAERAASGQQPGSYKEEETDDKIVGIPRVGPGENPIRGLDPE